MTAISVFSYCHLSDFLKSDFLFHIHFSVVICGFLVISSQITIVPMHVPFRIHYRNNLIDKKDSYPIPRPPSRDDRNCSYGHQLYPSDADGCSQKLLMNVVWQYSYCSATFCFVLIFGSFFQFFKLKKIYYYFSF